MKPLRVLALVSFGVFFLFLVLSALVMFADSGWGPFWHEYGWFGYVVHIP